MYFISEGCMKLDRIYSYHTMQTKNNAYVFLQKNMTGCRMFWGFMYTALFVSSWMSFYDTKIWADRNISVNMYVAMGFIIYWFLFMIIPLAYLIHKVLEEKVAHIKLVLGEGLTNAIFKFSVGSTFPVFSIYIGGVLQDVEAMWFCIYLVGSLLCFLMCYDNPRDYGLSYAFLGIWLGVYVHLVHPVAKLLMLIVVGVSFSISQFLKKSSCDERGE